MAKVRRRAIGKRHVLGVSTPLAAAVGLSLGTAPARPYLPQEPAPVEADGLSSRLPAAFSASRLEATEPPVIQTKEQALAQDLALVAEAKGWTVEEAAADYKAAEVVGRIAEQVAARWPDSFVGSVLSPVPGGAPVLYIKGPANQEIRTLVIGAELEVKIVDRQPFSFEELEQRKTEVHRALLAQGFRTVATGFNITDGGQINASVTRQPGLPTATSEILSGLPSTLRDRVTLTVSDKPVVEPERAFGGMWMRDDGANECTSGWSVRTPGGTTGVTTAGHCSGINQIADPAGPVHSLTFQREHRGAWGDVQWHTSNQDEIAVFFADATTTREVNAVEARANISVGESVCQYGRASNDRDCSLEVVDVSQACTDDGITHDRLVEMNGDTGIPGDSGGGWSFGTRAYGGHWGNCGDGHETWSVADLFDEALGVTVRVK